MEIEYMDLNTRFIEKLKNELSKLEASPLSAEFEMKEAIVDYLQKNAETQIMHIDFLSALFDQDNSLDYIYQNAKDIPISRLIGISSKGTFTLAEILELVGDDAYCEKVDIQRIQKIDGHAYFIRKPNSYNELESYTKMYESRNSAKASPYHVFKTIELDSVKYDDFLMGRLGYTHKFIADYAQECFENKYGILRCLRVKNADKSNQSVLIQSDGYDYARYIAIEKESSRNLSKRRKPNSNIDR